MADPSVTGAARNSGRSLFTAAEAAAAIAACPLIEWSGYVWRCHSRKYAGDDYAGSLQSTGRFHRASDKFPDHETWPALYAGLAEHIALGERLRHTTAIEGVANWRTSRLLIELTVVVDACKSPQCAELPFDDLTVSDTCHPNQYVKTHELALAVRNVAEALLTPSCTKFPEGNLVIFPDRLRATSRITVDHTNDPDLHIPWDRYR